MIGREVHSLDFFPVCFLSQSISVILTESLPCDTVHAQLQALLHVCTPFDHIYLHPVLAPYSFLLLSFISPCSYTIHLLVNLPTYILSICLNYLSIPVFISAATICFLCISQYLAERFMQSLYHSKHFLLIPSQFTYSPYLFFDLIFCMFFPLLPLVTLKHSLSNYCNTLSFICPKYSLHFVINSSLKFI